MKRPGLTAHIARTVPALALVAVLAACGVDGEPEPPTRAEASPANAILTPSSL